MKAIWNDTIIVESDNCIIIEGNYYFPFESVNMRYLRESDLHSICPWKGKANYYNIVVGGKYNINAAWYYSTPKKVAENVGNRVAFWHGVNVVD